MNVKEVRVAMKGATGEQVTGAAEARRSACALLPVSDSLARLRAEAQRFSRDPTVFRTLHAPRSLRPLQQSSRATPLAGWTPPFSTAMGIFDSETFQRIEADGLP